MSSTNGKFYRRTLDQWCVFALIGLAFSISLALYLHYLDISRFRWGGMDNDRNAHYLFGLNLALDVLHFDVKNLLSDLDGARVWPPLHGLLVGILLLFGGLDYRLAVLPSLAGWIGTVILGFLLARRAVPRGGNLAGFVAAVFIFASPAHRVFGTDVMLESLGACLSLLVLYLYLIAVEQGSERTWRNFGLSLTAIFLLKYNYWLFLVTGIVAARVAKTPPQPLWRFIRGPVTMTGWRTWAWNEIRNPLNIIALISLSLMIIVLLTNGWTYELWGKTISIRSHHNFVQVAYVALFVRAVLKWREDRQKWRQSLDPCFRQLVLWHALPVAVWFLLPKRLGYFLFFLSPANGPNSPPSFLWGLDFYWKSLQHDYHTGIWGALLATVLAGLALLAFRRLKPGALALVFFVILAALLTIAHPNRKSRFLHSWVPAVWVLAGVGASMSVYRRVPRRRDPFVATALVSVLVLWQLQDPFAPGHSPEVGHQKSSRTALDVTDFYLPHLAHSRKVTFLATVPVKHIAQWTYLERYHDRDGLEVFLRQFGSSRDANTVLFQKWLRTTLSDTIVFVDVPPGSQFDFPGERYYQQYRELLYSQSVFKLSLKRHFPEYGCTVTLWRRDTKAFRG